MHLSESRFYDADLSNSEMSAVGFYHARLHHSLLSGMKATDANFTGARIDHCDFSRAELAGSNFFRAEITQCSFRNADLRNCDFREARVRGLDLRGANLRGSVGLKIAQAITDDRTISPE
jgi:uncharacterized protein YjbI with pentapeptide repeats